MIARQFSIPPLGNWASVRLKLFMTWVLLGANITLAPLVQAESEYHFDLGFDDFVRCFSATDEASILACLFHTRTGRCESEQQCLSAASERFRTALLTNTAVDDLQAGIKQELDFCENTC